jgi:hypothetical protein
MPAHAQRLVTVVAGDTSFAKQVVVASTEDRLVEEVQR